MNYLQRSHAVSHTNTVTETAVDTNTNAYTERESGTSENKFDETQTDDDADDVKEINQNTLLIITNGWRRTHRTF